MEKIVLTLQSFDQPIWTIDEENGTRQHGLPYGMEFPSEIAQLASELQNRYNAYFKEEEDAIIFTGLESEKDRVELEKESKELEAAIKKLVPEYIVVENRIPTILLAAPIKGKKKEKNSL